jgi:hypothetical protein
MSAATEASPSTVIRLRIGDRYELRITPVRDRTPEACS